MIYNNYHIVYFDGECILCNAFFKKLLHWDKENQLHYAVLQNPQSQAYLTQFENYNPEIDSVLYTFDGKLYFQDQAVFEISKLLPFPYSLLQYGRIFPSWFSEGVYRFIAKNRFSIWGKQQCFIPTDDVKSRFLFL